MATFADIGVAAGINILFAVAFLVAFAFLRLQPINDRVYFPKWYLKGLRSSPINSGSLVGKFVNLDWRSYVRFLNWVPDALRMPEPELIDHAGLDSAAYLRIYLLGYATLIATPTFVAFELHSVILIMKRFFRFSYSTHFLTMHIDYADLRYLFLWHCFRGLSWSRSTGRTTPWLNLKQPISCSIVTSTSFLFQMFHLDLQGQRIFNSTVFLIFCILIIIIPISYSND